MNKNELRKNEIIEQMLESKWMGVYVNKLNKKFSKYSTKDWNPSKDSLISNLWESLIIYERNNDINASFVEIEKYCFQKAYILTSEEFISETGKYRMGKKKEWQQTLVEYKDELQAKKHYYDDYPSLADEYVYDSKQLDSLANKAYACDFAENLTKSQSTFVKSVLNLGVDATIHNLELNKKSFNNRLNRTIKAIETKRNKYNIVSEKDTVVADRLSLIDLVVNVIEDEQVNEIMIFKSLAGLYESELSYLYYRAFDGVEAELAYQSFKENKGRHYAYQLCDAIYDEKDKLENMLRVA